MGKQRGQQVTLDEVERRCETAAPCPAGSIHKDVRYLVQRNTSMPQ